MIPGITAGGFVQASAMPTTRIALPLTYDEKDYNGLLSWSRAGGPLPTPQGAEFDGYEARLKANASLPGWLTSASGPLTLHASVTPFQAPPTSSDAQVVSVCTDDANFRPRLALACTQDSQDTTLAQIAAQSYTSSLQSKRLCRREWRYEFRHPELVVAGKKVRPQGVLFLDDNTVLITAHYEDTLSRCHKIRLSDRAVLGWFDFPSPHLHVGAIARKSDGSFWFGDFAVGALLGVNLDASFAANFAVITTTYSCAALNGFSAIDWATISGTEYLLAAEYLTAGTPYLYVIPATAVTNGGTFAATDRAKRFVCSQRSQGVRFYGAKLYIAMNRLTAEVTAVGRIQRYTLNLAAADGTTLAAEATWVGPGQYVEDIDFHPSTGWVWSGTEGCTAVGSDDGWLAYWSSPMDNSAVENHYTLEYNGAGAVRIKVNDTIFEDMVWTPTPTPGAVTLGARPVQAAGWSSGFFSGTVRNVVIQDYPMSGGEYRFAVDGSYEPNSLIAYSLTLTNPGAEAGDASGWTSESGALAVRSSNPLPHTGSFYFYDAANPATLARQRHAMPAPDAAVDAGKAWGRVRWFQASFNTGTDTSAMGLRFLSSTPSQISQSLAASILIAPTMAWRYRTFSAAAPANTRFIDALITMARASGTASDGYTDDISLTVYSQ